MCIRNSEDAETSLHIVLVGFSQLQVSRYINISTKCDSERAVVADGRREFGEDCMVEKGGRNILEKFFERMTCPLWRLLR